MIPDLTTDERTEYGIKFDTPMTACGEIENVFSFLDGKTTGLWDSILWRLGKSTKPTVGWTAGMQWVVCGSQACFRLYYGRDRLVITMEAAELPAETPYDGPTKRIVWRVFASKALATKVALFADQIAADIDMCRTRLRDLPFTSISQFTESNYRLGNETYPVWINSISDAERDDHLHMLLRNKYREEYEAVRLKETTLMVRSLMEIARALGARYVSLTRESLIVLEDIRIDGLISEPIAWEVLKSLNCFLEPLGTVGASAMGLPKFLPEQYGTYDVMADEPVRVCDPVPARQDEEKAKRVRSSAPENPNDVAEWVASCGVSNRRNVF